MTPSAPSRGPRLVVALVAGAVLVEALQVGAFVGLRSVVDHRQSVSELRLDSALETFRPVERSGLASPADLAAFRPDRNPKTRPAACRSLTVLTSTVPLDARSWTGVGGHPAQPVTLLTARFADAGTARRELDRKRVALVRCARLDVTFPPYDAPATTYTVAGRHWAGSVVGSSVRWSLEGGGRRFDFYVRRYGNTLTWTYADDVSTSEVREEVADSLVARLQDLAGR